MRNDTDFTDVTLVCEGNQRIEAHKVVLAASSPVFEEILKGTKQSNLLVYMRGTNAQTLLSIVDFIYYGEIIILQDDLNIFLALSEELQLKGIIGINQAGVLQTDSSLAKAKQIKNNFADIIVDNVTIKSLEEEVPKDDQTDFIKYVVQSNEIKQSIDISNASEFDDELDKKIFMVMVKFNGFWKCQNCGKSDKSKRNMMSHIEVMHMEGAPNRCNQCGKLYRSRNLLKGHISYAHTDRA